MNQAGETTLGDLMLTLAERMGWHKVPNQSDNRSQLPDDPNLRDRLLRAINAGRQEVYRRMPSAWVFRPRITITLDPTGTGAQCVDNSPAKYALPYNCPATAGTTWTWSLGTGYGGQLEQRHPADVVAMHAGDTTGASRPTTMALVHQTLNNPQEPGRRTTNYLHIWPTPDQAYTLEGEIRLLYGPLYQLNDLEPMGEQHAQLIVTAGERDIKLNHPDLAVRKEINERFNEQVEISIELDNQSKPQTIGVGYDPDAERQAMRYRPVWPAQRAIVTHVNGVSVL